MYLYIYIIIYLFLDEIDNDHPVASVKMSIILVLLKLNKQIGEYSIIGVSYSF